MAGNGAGRAALDRVLADIAIIGRDGPDAEVEPYDDVRTGLVLEPLRWALRHQPEWTAWEQVTPVRPVWEACADVLRANGYSVWTGNVTSEQYGVPQTRKRTALIGSRVREVGEPPVTHRKYRKGVAQHEGDQSLHPWVSMADALGRGMTARPFSSKVDRNKWEMRSNALSHACIRAEDEPSATITAGHDAGERRWQLRNNTSANACTRTDSDPAPTPYFGERANGVYWESFFSSEDDYAPVPANEEDPDDSRLWVKARPSPTIVGSFAPEIVAAPGYRKAGDGPRQNATGSVRVSVDEASTLQSFPQGYPWQGSKTKQYQQVGNAIPPLLALHILAMATGIDVPTLGEVAA